MCGDLACAFLLAALTSLPPLRPHPQTTQFESWALPWAMQQIMYTRQYFAENPQLLAANVGNATSNSTSMASDPNSPASTSTAASASSTSSMSSGAASSSMTAGALAAVAGLAVALLA